VIDDRDLFERAVRQFPPPERSFDRLIALRNRKQRNQRITGGVVGIAIAIAAVLVGTSIIRSDGERPGDLTPPLMHNGLIALPSDGTLPLLDSRTGIRSELNLRTGRGGYEVVGFTWSPDGSKFAYTTEQQATVRVYDLETGSISRIVPCEAPPPYHVGCKLNVAWSPDGSRIALSGPGGLDLVDPDGSNRITLIHLSGARGYVGSATWSPDGTTIAFTARVPGSVDLQAIYEIDADGSNLRVLFHQPGSVAPRGLLWSPDGSRIAYLVDVPQAPLTGPGGPYPVIPQVWIVDADGSGPSKLYEGGACCAGGNSTGLSWSPDGTMIAFIASPPGTPYGSQQGETNTDPRLYGIDPDDGSARVLARYVCLCGPPAWQPVP
jgi:Tol biopolymer transport system component